MITLPNVISLLRIPLALAFLQSHPTLRVYAIFGALITDWLDGFLARRNRNKTKIGALLDPLTDRFFVFFALSVLVYEMQIELWEILALASRDFAIVLFGGVLTLIGKIDRVIFKAIWCGKVTTVMQLFVLFSLTLGYHVPQTIYPFFFLLAFLALFELSYKNYRQKQFV
ncbi:MAG: CDP-alcohol phosphatidyltransferase family protein [Chlamydiales bacterium]